MLLVVLRKGRQPSVVRSCLKRLNPSQKGNAEASKSKAE